MELKETMTYLRIENTTLELNQLLLWEGPPFAILITTLLVFGLLGIGINALFVYYIKNHTDANRPINAMIAIQQVKITLRNLQTRFNLSLF